MEELRQDRSALIAAAMGEEGNLVSGRFARGCRCFAVLIDGVLGGYGWLAFGPEWVGELQLEVEPRQGEGYIWNCVTLAEHRRLGIFRSLLIGISNVARQEGMKRLWMGSIAIPAERAVARSGFRAALNFTTMNVAGLHWMRVRPCSDPALVAAACSVLSVRPGWSVRRSQARRH